jgi:hypothetical protein
MVLNTHASLMAFALTAVVLAGCAGEGNDNIFTTGALGNQAKTARAAEPNVDAACISLATRIDGLRQEGIAEKIEKASVNKYKMTQKDLAKADQLIKADSEFQIKCTTVTAKPTTARAG